MLRTIESVMAVAVLLAQAGIPSLAVREAAFIEDLEDRGALLQQFLVSGVVCAVVVALVVALVAPILVDGVAAGWLRLLVWVLMLTTTTRIALGYFQGVQLVHKTAVVSAVAALVGLLGFGLLVPAFGISGWLAARYAAEAIMLAVIVFFAWPHLKLSKPRFRTINVGMWADGAVISASLLVRAIQDSAVIILLGWLGLSMSDIGYFALGALLAFPVLLLPGVISNLSIARFVRSPQEPTLTRALLRRLTIAATMSAFGVALVLSLVGPALVLTVLSDYAPAVPVILILLLAASFRGVPGTVGGLLIATGQSATALVVNTIAATISIGAVIAIAPVYGVLGVAYAILAIEIITCAAYFWLARAILQRLAYQR